MHIVIGPGEDRVARHVAGGVEGDLVNRAVAEIADVQVALAVEDDAVQAVLAELVLGAEAGNHVLVFESIRDLDIFVVQAETVDRTDQQARRVLDLRHQAFGDVQKVAVDAGAVGMFHALGHHRAGFQLVVLDPQAQHAAPGEARAAAFPALVVADVEIAVRPEGEAHRAGDAGLGQGRDLHPLPHLVVLADLDQTCLLGRVGKVGTGHHQVAVGGDFHAVRRDAEIRQADEEFRGLQAGSWAAALVP